MRSRAPSIRFFPANGWETLNHGWAGSKSGFSSSGEALLRSPSLLHLNSKIPLRSPSRTGHLASSRFRHFLRHIAKVKTSIRALKMLSVSPHACEPVKVVRMNLEILFRFPLLLYSCLNVLSLTNLPGIPCNQINIRPALCLQQFNDICPISNL